MNFVKLSTKRKIDQSIFLYEAFLDAFLTHALNSVSMRGLLVENDISADIVYVTQTLYRNIHNEFSFLFVQY